MSADRDVTRIVRSWLHEDAYENADRILNLVLDEIDTTPQRSPSWLARRFPPMNSTMRIALAVATVAVAAVVGVSLLLPRNVGNPTPSATPTATPTASPPLLNTLPLGELAAGTYEIDAVFPVRLTFTVPDGFEHGRGHLGRRRDPGQPRRAAASSFRLPPTSIPTRAIPPLDRRIHPLAAASTTLSQP